MRVLHLSAEFPPLVYGGLGMALGGLATASAQAGMNVGVLLVTDTEVGYYGQPLQVEHADPDLLSTGPRSDGVQLFQLPHVGAVEGAIRLIQSWRPDVLHVHPVELWPMAAAIRQRTATRLVYTVHSLNVCEYEIGGALGCVPLWQMQQELIAAADRVVALTEDERLLIEQHCAEAVPRIRIVGNGISECPRALQAAKRETAPPAPTVLFTGRFVERKGLYELLAAIPEVLAAAPETRFVLAGGHRYCTAEEMQRLWLPAELRPYAHQIYFTGWLSPEEVAAWYCAADVLVVPSWYEPFGMVILEGMLHGLPIAAADIGGPAEILRSEHTGLLVPPRDAAALAQALIRLVTQPSLRQRLGRAAAQEVRERWLWPSIVKKMQRVYLEAATGQPH